MKKISLIICVLFVFAACRKNLTSENDHESNNIPYFEKVKQYLKDSLDKQVYLSIDFNKVSRFHANKENSYLTRIECRGGDDASDVFMLLRSDSLGNVSKGYIMDVRIDKQNKGKSSDVNGLLKMRNIGSNKNIEFAIVNGFIKKDISAMRQMDLMSETDMIWDEGNRLPDVVMVSYFGGGGSGYSFSVH
jgi:hypothetical protein